MTEPDLEPAVERPALEAARPYWWMRPAWVLNILRPGLRAATDADSRRLRLLPGAIATLLPIAAVLIPTLASVGQATTGPFVQGDPYDPWTLVLYDVFTESIPFMLVGLVIGLLSPAAGVLFVLAYAAGNLVVTTISGELEPPLPALYGRFASFIILWLLVVEIPLFARSTIERSRGHDAPLRGRFTALLTGWLLAMAATLAWALSAGLLIGVVFWLTRGFGSGPTLRATNTLEVSAHLFVIPAAILAFILLAVRYRGRQAPLAINEPADAPPSRFGRLARQGLGIAMAFVVLSGTLHQVIDVVVLLGGLVLARPLARLALRATGLAGPIARLPVVIRLGGAGAVAFAFSYGFLSVFYGVEISRWFYGIIAIVVSFFVLQVALVAEEIEGDRPPKGSEAGGAERSPVATTVTSLLLALLLGTFALPATVFADAFGDLGDTAFFIATNGLLGAAIGAAMLYGALMGGDKAPPPEKKQPPPPINPYARKPGGPPPTPFGKPPPKAPPRDDGFKPTDISTWF